MPLCPNKTLHIQAVSQIYTLDHGLPFYSKVDSEKKERAIKVHLVGILIQFYLTNMAENMLEAWVLGASSYGSNTGHSRPQLPQEQKEAHEPYY